MNIQQLIQLYSESEKINYISEKLNSGGNFFVHLKNTIGSANSFIVAALSKKTNSNHLIILPDKEDAAYFFNDLENIISPLSLGERQERLKPLFFPQSYRRPYQVEETDNSNILLRAEVLNKILKASPDNKYIIVTYPEALYEKVVTKAHLSKNTLTLSVKENISIAFITDVLFEYDFQRVDYVVEPGQYSVRGGIVDIYSFSDEYPYRVEFFGDVVDSIRTFDPASQLSIKNFNTAAIIPNVQGKLVMESRQSFLEYIPDNTAIWIKDFQFIYEKTDKEFEHAQKAYTVIDSAIEHLKPEELFITGELLKEQVEKKIVVEFGTRFYFDPGETINFNFAPQPSFNKSFDLLLDNLKGNITGGLKNIIFSDTARQVERLYSIFEDLISKNKNGTTHLPSADAFTPIHLSIHEGFIDKDLKLACYTDHQIFERYHRFRLKESFNKKNEAITLKELKALNPGDYITHIDHGIGRFGGLEKIEVGGKHQEAIRLVYKDNDVLYIPIHALHRIAKYAGKESDVPKIDKLGSNAWQNLKQKTKKKIKEIAFDLVKLYAQRKAQKGFQFSPDNYLQNELEASFIYEDTPDQLKATQDVKKDMEQSSPMDRLVCGDVGFGKTEIAIRAAFKAVLDGKQVAVLVPTTILALQHFKTFKDRMKDLPCTVDYINRFKSPKEQKETLQKLQEGKVDIVIGTHKLAGKEVKFKDLGLLIIDEEQKFGVSVKDKLKTLKTNVDTLTLTATPIPRTLQFSLMGSRDLSIINTAPPNRYPVQTEVHLFNEETIRDAIMDEVQRGGQVFFVHNRVQNIMEITGMIQRLCPDVKIGSGHGQMEGEKLEEVMLKFIDGDYDVLVSTAIIESGLDISNANTIIVNDAQMFGLSDLHQLRGRVGRSNKKAFCYLLTPPFSVLTTEARKRLKAIEEFSDLGSGLNIAMRDLDIRGAGNLLGAEQSGFITDIGYEMYQKILDEALGELRMEKEELRTNDHSKPTSFVKDCQVETDMEILIPDEYVSNITERLSLYKALDESKKEEDLSAFEKQLKDRFGPVPLQTLELINTIRLRWLAQKAGIEKLVLKNEKMVGYFVSNQQASYYQSDIFSQVLQYVQQHQSSCKMKEGNNKLTLTFERIKTIDDAITVLKKVYKEELVSITE